VVSRHSTPIRIDGKLEKDEWLGLKGRRLSHE